MPRDISKIARPARAGFDRDRIEPARRTRSFAKDVMIKPAFDDAARLVAARKWRPAMAARFGAAIVTLLLTTAPSQAGPCRDSIDRVQARVDAIIAKRAGQGPWKPESLDALRSYQPTPRSIAAAEGNGSRVQRALNALDRARAADGAGNIARCNAELKRAMRALGSQ